MGSGTTAALDQMTDAAVEGSDRAAAAAAAAAATIVLPEYTAVISLVLCSLVLGVGVMGNLLVIVVILTSKVLRSSTNLFLLNLSVADLLVLVTCTPSALAEIATRKDAWIMGKVLCYSVPLVELAVSHTSVLTILAITVERYYAICLPLRAGEVCTKAKACVTCLISWVIAFGLTAPILTMIEYRPPGLDGGGLLGSGGEVSNNVTGSLEEEVDGPLCLTIVDTSWRQFYFILLVTVFFFIPLVVLVWLYRQIARRLVPSQDDQHIVTESTAVLRSRRQVMAMLFTVVIFFFACMLPFKVLTLWIVTWPTEVFDVISQETYFNLLYFARIMFYTNSAINPILYNIMSSKFRRGFLRVFQRATCRTVTLSDEDAIFISIVKRPTCTSLKLLTINSAGNSNSQAQVSSSQGRRLVVDRLKRSAAAATTPTGDEESDAMVASTPPSPIVRAAATLSEASKAKKDMAEVSAGGASGQGWFAKAKAKATKNRGSEGSVRIGGGSWAKVSSKSEDNISSSGSIVLIEEKQYCYIKAKGLQLNRLASQC